MTIIQLDCQYTTPLSGSGDYWERVSCYVACPGVQNFDFPLFYGSIPAHGASPDGVALRANRALSPPYRCHSFATHRGVPWGCLWRRQLQFRFPHPPRVGKNAVPSYYHFEHPVRIVGTREFALVTNAPRPFA